MSVAVVIPAYNASRFIADTLQSVFNQTLVASEIIVVDDGSTDDTPEIAESFDPKVRVFRRTNSGPGGARNFGVEQAISDWVAFIDADDLWEATKLEKQMAKLSMQPGADICYTDRARFIQSADGQIRVLETPSHHAPWFPAEQIQKGLYQSVTFLPSSALIRRCIFLHIGGFSSRPVAEDWDLWLRLLHSGAKFVSCSEPLLLYRVHSNNTSGNLAITMEENLKVYRAQVLPHLSGLERVLSEARFMSRYNVDRAFLMREVKNPHCLAVMTKSISQWPFGESYRYKVWLHMLLTRLGLLKWPGQPEH